MGNKPSKQQHYFLFTFHFFFFLDDGGNSVWKVKLSPIKSGGPHTIVASSIVQEKNVNVALQNVMFGDVWLCSGQSNMEFTVGMVNILDMCRFFAQHVDFFHLLSSNFISVCSR